MATLKSKKDFRTTSSPSTLRNWKNRSKFNPKKKKIIKTRVKISKRLGKL